LAPKLAPHAILPLTSVGIEDLTIDLQGVGRVGVGLTQAWGSWIKNIEIIHSAGKVLTLYSTLNCEVRHSSFRLSATAGGPNTEGVDLYREVGWSLIEDNIIEGIGGLVIGDAQGGDVGNVIAYNYIYGSLTGSPDVAGQDIDLNHGANNSFNLIEGNIAGGLIADEYFGSSSHDTIFRNWLTATHPTGTNNLAAIKLKRLATYMSAVGNVLGTADFPTSGSMMGQHAFGGFYEAPVVSGYDNGWSTGVQVIYELGFPNIGNSFFVSEFPVQIPLNYQSYPLEALDHNVANSLLRHANFDYFHRAVVWDPSIPARSLPESLFRASKPSWFGSLVWPPFDPASPPGRFSDTTKQLIPAGYRAVHGIDP
jgi:hypothetical protein